MARLGTSFRLVSAVSAGLWHLQAVSSLCQERFRLPDRPPALCGRVWRHLHGHHGTDQEAPRVGGSALNQGRQLHSLGVPVRFVGAVGKDAIGHALLEQVSGQGSHGMHVLMPLLCLLRARCDAAGPSVQLRCVDENAARSSAYAIVCIVLSGPADRAFVSCYSTTDAFTERDLQEQAHKLEDCTHFHLGGYFNMKGPCTRSTTPSTPRFAPQRNATGSVELRACSNGHWCGEDNHLASFLDHVDLLFVNASEGEHICAALCPDSDRSISALCKRYPELMVVITQGSHGCTAYRHQMPAVYVPAKQTRVVDTTGAGDAFIAGFLSSWLPHAAPKRSEAEQKAIVDACKKGHAVASVVLGREGACVEPVRPRAPGFAKKHRAFG
ncbi:unnamed protein product [Durusdinium trenchii]|uniref:Carbohydrate kinase PfkB domain-containing protein n=1 Tax=Durusdinium trenchii TaxID=1381693 RepID=A0ABP0P0E6_9DINO